MDGFTSCKDRRAVRERRFPAVRRETIDIWFLAVSLCSMLICAEQACIDEKFFQVSQGCGLVL